LSSITRAQTHDNCSTVGIIWDTTDITCKGTLLDTICSEIIYCEDSKLKLYGTTTYGNGKEYLYFSYKYKKGKPILKRITFWTFHYIKSGYVTDNKYASINYPDKGVPKLDTYYIQDKFPNELREMTIEFGELITQIK